MVNADRRRDSPSPSTDEVLRALVRLLARQAARDALCDQVERASPDAEPVNKSKPY